MGETQKFRIQHLPNLLLKTGKAWFEGEPFERSAIIAYYAVLSLPALLIIILKFVGGFWDEDVVRGEILGDISEALGRDVGEAILGIIENQSDKETSLVAIIIGIGTLVYGSTGVFFQLQSALDKIWEKVPHYKNSIISMLMSRAKSFGFILILGFLLLTSFVLTTLLSAFSRQLNRILPEDMINFIFIIDLVISVGFIYILFATMFKFLPSAKVTWKSVRIGAALTTVLFLIGKYVLALYFNTMEPGSTYGAAGSIILIMLWTSYSSLILLFGAHFTKQYSDRYVVGITSQS